MRNHIAIAAGIGVAFAVVGCHPSRARTVEAASAAWSCPEEKIAATEVGENVYRAVGCGKQGDFYCDVVYENQYTAAQSSSLVCQPVQQAIDDAKRGAEVAQGCADRCNNVGLSCQSGCEGSSQCRSGCDALAQGCMDACVAKYR